MGKMLEDAINQNKELPKVEIIESLGNENNPENEKEPVDRILEKVKEKLMNDKDLKEEHILEGKIDLFLAGVRETEKAKFLAESSTENLSTEKVEEFEEAFMERITGYIKKNILFRK